MSSRKKSTETVRRNLCCFFVFFFLIFRSAVFAQSPGLYINEVSQGPTGNKEYVELLVVGTPTCYAIPTLDLRGWYIDDNNGFHATGAGTGIATGCVRLTQDPLWAAIPIGTIIVFYNDADINASIPAQDLSMSDGNCRLIIPISNCTLLEKNVTSPSVSISTYPTTGFTSCGNWNNISMANSDDSFQTIDPLGNLFHSVSWGNNTLSPIIYFAGTATATVALMTNASNNNISLQANWSRLAVAGNESPGAANNAANLAWICKMNNGCTPLTAISSTVSVVNAGCICNGSATVIPSGGFTGCGNLYTYNWAPSGGNTATASSLCAGTYSVTITDINGCTGTRTVAITSVPAFTLSTAPSNVSCNGGNNGSATVTATGGTGPFTYSWAPYGGSNATATGLVAGTYTVTVTDANGCSSTTTVSITQPAALTATTSSSPALCNGASTGSAAVVAGGGAGSYTYSWSPAGGTGATASGIPAQNYTVTVTDANGCSTTATTSVTQPAAIVPGGSHTNELCNGGNTAMASVNPSGGTGAYTYSWSPSGGNAATANNLTAGNYTVTITDANNCISTQSFVITQPTAIAIVASANNSTCSNANGSVTASVSGGLGPYTYNWTPGSYTSSTVVGLLAGTYSVNILDQNGCSATASVTIGNIGAPVVSLSASANVSCFGGSDGTATVAASGGSGTLTYAWSPAGGNAAGAVNLAAGTYTCTVTDQAGCSNTQTVLITEPALLTASAATSSVLCFGGNTGSATITANGGTGAYSYVWSPSGGNNANANSLIAGNYTCTVTDANGCTTTQSVQITEPNALALTASSTDPSCANTCDGILNIAASGGTGSYVYNWSSGCTTANCVNTCAGSFSVLVTDQNGCSDSAQIVLNAPPAITIATSFTDANCNLPTGSASATASGGAGSFVYNWLPSGSGQTISNIVTGSYTVIAADANGCTDTSVVLVGNIPGVTATAGPATNVSCFGFSDGTAIVNAVGGNPAYQYSWLPNISVNDTASGIPSGNYQVTVTDADGCSSSVTITITQPTQLLPGLNSNAQAICAGQSIPLAATPSGGTPVYSVNWNPGNLIGNSVNITPANSGTYSVTVTDQNGCTATDSVQITVNESPLAAFTQDIQSGCAPVCISFSDASSVTPPATISSWIWDFGDGNTSTQQQPQHCYNTPGNYNVTLSAVSSAGCKDSIVLNSAVTVFANPVAEFSYSPTQPTILDPQINFTDMSTGAASWSWVFGDLNQSVSALQNPSFSYSEPDCYNVLLNITSADGCTDSVSYEICIAPEVEIYVPNAFTPNNDGHNDFFFPTGEGLDWSTFHMLIFDRWGNLIYETSDINAPWNGKANGGSETAQIDVYVWKLEIRDIQSNNHFLTGHVSLIR